MLDIAAKPAKANRPATGAKPASTAKPRTSAAKPLGNRVPALPGGKAPRRARAASAASNPPRPARRQRPTEVREMFARLRDANPAPTTELEFSSPYELLVAVTLSAQMTDVGVNKATRRLFPVANTPAAIAALGVEGLAPYIATINFNRTKGANVVAAALRLLKLHGGEVPRDREALEALPGVGRKTANVVLNTAFAESTMAVDTHIFRVSNRTGLALGRTVRDVEDALLRAVPEEFLRDAHHWLILHGRYTCKARTPECPRCIVRDLCQYTAKTPGKAPPLEVSPPPLKKKSPRKSGG